MKKRKKFFDKLNISAVSNSENFWKVMEPFFTKKASFGGYIKPIDKKEILKDNTEIAAQLNIFMIY